MSQKDHIPQIDGLRGIAVICVLIAHFWPYDFIYRAFQFGRFGVTLFFAISGFLISNILINSRLQIEKKYTTAQSLLLKFYYRRALRIFPIYYGSLLFFCLISYQPITSMISWHLLYISNFGQAFYDLSFGNASHFWSLCTEEQFYIFIPMVILFLPIKTSFRVLCGIVIFCFFLKVTLSFIYHDWLLSTKLPFGNIEGLFFGILVAYSNHISNLSNILSKYLPKMYIFFIFVTITLSFYRFHIEEQAYSSPLYIAFLDLAFIMSLSPMLMTIFIKRENRIFDILLTLYPLLLIGRISYGVYVYHYLLSPFFIDFGEYFLIDSTLKPYLNFLIKSFISILLAYFSFNFLEVHILKLKNLASIRSRQVQREVRHNRRY